MFNYILARKWEGKWLLRVEDTDQSRFQPGALDNMRHALEWAGLDYDEGVGAGGSFGPYTQSERLDIYQHYAKDLLSRGEAYECFCTPEELKAIRLSLNAQGHTHSYDGRCKHMTEEEVARRKAAGNKFVVRYKNSPGDMDLPPDLIFGTHQPTAIIGEDDFVLIKSDGWPTYHLASVVDDHLMEISHVIRGEEWLPSVPKHHRLYQSFGWTPPTFGHLPLLCNPNGMKLSKRNKDAFVQLYIDQGYEPDALINYLALMGWDYNAALSSTAGPLDPHVRSDGHSLYELFSLPQLIAAFDPKHVNHRKATVNHDKLHFLNKMTLRRKAGRLGKDGVMVGVGKVQDAADESERVALVKRFQASLKEEEELKGCETVDDFDFVNKVFDAELPRTRMFREMSKNSILYFVQPEYTSDEAKTTMSNLNTRIYIRYVQAFAGSLRRHVATARHLDRDVAWDAINEVLKEFEIKKKVEFMGPIRHALTERVNGPSIPELVEILGLSETLTRLTRAQDFVKRLRRHRVPEASIAEDDD
ncbi:glutamate-tRNA ligase [Cryptococcus sp. DSM 104549]